MKNTRRRLATTLLVAAFLPALALAQGATPAKTAKTPRLEGRYHLQGVSETGGELRLSPEGRFSFGLSYGAVDRYAEGRWSVRADQVELVSDTLPPPSLKLGAVSGDFGETPERPILLLVHVASPKLGLNWSSMEITAEFSNGRTRSGETGRSGTLGFLVLEGAEWEGATVRRVSVSSPNGDVGPVWFDIDPRTTKRLTVEFEPGSLVPQVFETLTLQVERGPADAVALVLRNAGGRETRFVRH